MFNRANKEKEEQKQMQGESVISTNEMNAYDDIPINDMEG